MTDPEIIEGPCGRAEPIRAEDRPNDQNMATTVCAWLITSPGWHPLWSQYLLSVIDLADHPNMAPATHHYPGATHELLVLALNPEHGPYTPTSENVRHLTPVNIVHQFTATHEEMRELAWLAARAVVHGGLNPETGDAPTLIREQWLTACVKGLAHIRGEEHAP